MSKEEKYYTREEMDNLMMKHIEKNAEILKKDLYFFPFFKGEMAVSQRGII